MSLVPITIGLLVITVFIISVTSTDDKKQQGYPKYQERHRGEKTMSETSETKGVNLTIGSTANKNNARTVTIDRIKNVATASGNLSTGKLRFSEIGTSFFYDLVVVNDVYVDKSLFIRDFLNSSDKVVLITRPNRWGKTINMDMLRTFLEIELDANYTLVEPEKNSNRKLFFGGTIETDDGRKKVLPALRIAGWPECMQQQGRYPVIQVSFKNIEGRRFEDIENGLKKRIRMLFLNYQFLEENDRISSHERAMLKSYMSGQFDKEDLKSSLYFLSRMLKNHFGKKVFVLIDEYDTPIRNLFVKLKEQTKVTSKVLVTHAFKQSYLLFRGILNECLKDNEYLKRALVTGIVRTEMAVSGMNNLSEYNLLDEDFSEYFGFNESEVSELMRKVQSPLERLEVKRWYEGFRYGGRQLLYNPWSIVQCLKSEKMKPYWLQSDDSCLIEKKLIKHKYRPDIRKIMTDGTVTMTIDHEFDFNILSTKNGLFNALLFLGYLNPVSTNDMQCVVNIPNEEIRIWYEKQTTE